MKKALIIFIEGQDRSGKTSLIKPLFKKTGSIHNIIDRGPLSNYVYSKMYNRKVDLLSYLEILKRFEILTFFLDTNVEIIKNRTILTNDYQVPLNEIQIHKTAWLEAYEKISDYKNSFRLNNSNLTINETVSKIIKIIDKYQGELND